MSVSLIGSSGYICLYWLGWLPEASNGVSLHEAVVHHHLLPCQVCATVAHGMRHSCCECLLVEAGHSACWHHDCVCSSLEVHGVPSSLTSGHRCCLGLIHMFS